MSSRTLPDHLISLPTESTGRWALWRTVAVRGAGFPASGVDKLADAECVRAAERLRAVEDESETLREAALAAVRREIEAAGKDRLDGLIKVIRRLKRGQVAPTAALAENPDTVAAVEAWNTAAGRTEAERESYGAVHKAASERVERALHEVAADDRFREAIVWQNRHAAETGLASFLRRPVEDGPGSARDRGHSQLLASYLQRYSVKNDTVGFMGPVGWGRLSDSPEPITVRPGESLLEARQVYCEGWGIDALVDHLAEDEAIRPWLAPRLSPYLRREGNNYVTPDGQTLQFGPLSSALLAACDGTRSARVLMRELGDALTPDKEEILWKLLADMERDGALSWTFQIPLSSTPEVILRDLLAKVEDEPARTRALALLDELLDGRAAVARAAGNAAEVERALRELEQTFTRITGRAATRGAGELYAGRTLVYEDCRRDLELELGAPFLADLAPALSLVLASARWFTHFVANHHRTVFAGVYAELQPGGGPIDLLTYMRVALPQVVNLAVRKEIHGELQSRWQKVLALPEGQRRVQLKSEDLLPRVQEAFAAPGPGWQKARHHSPDLLIAAPSVEAIRQGDYQVVLGEVHVAINTLDRALFFSQHPHPEELRAGLESDLPEPSLIPLFPKEWNQSRASSRLGMMAPTVNGRMDVALRSEKDFYLDFSLDAPGVPPSHVLALADLVVERGPDGALVVGPRDGRVRFESIDFFQLVMLLQALALFQVQPTTAYVPRVTIDRLVVARESWTFGADDLGFAAEKTAAARFAGARRWAARFGLPRQVFVKTAGEGKPFFVDLDSPILVEIFAKAVRKALPLDPQSGVTVSEMIPGPGEVWLPDAAGNGYTSELRVVALDLEG